MAVLADQDQLPLGVHRNDADAGTVVDPALSAEPAVGQTNIALEDIKNTAVIDEVPLQFGCFSHSASGFPFLWLIFFIQDIGEPLMN